MKPVISGQAAVSFPDHFLPLWWKWSGNETSPVATSLLRSLLLVPVTLILVQNDLLKVTTCLQWPKTLVRVTLWPLSGWSSQKSLRSKTPPTARFAPLGDLKGQEIKAKYLWLCLFAFFPWATTTDRFHYTYNTWQFWYGVIVIMKSPPTSLNLLMSGCRVEIDVPPSILR